MTTNGDYQLKAETPQDEIDLALLAKLIGYLPRVRVTHAVLTGQSFNGNISTLYIAIV